MFREMNLNQNMFNVFKRLATLTCLIGCLLLIGSQALAQSSSEKELGVRRSDSGLKVTFEPVKQSYQVDESVRFRIKGNQTFYLYLFSINKEKNRAALLIPNDMHGNKYQGETTYLVPNKNLEFYSDQPGLEKVVMVASTKYLDLDKDRYTKAGPFRTMSQKQAETQLKTLRIRTAEDKTEKVVKEINLRIQPGPEAEFVGQTEQGRDEDSAMVFISCDQEAYHSGDLVRIAYGASESGWVYLYYVEPDGQKNLLTKKEVDKDKVNYVRARAERPFGKHALVAMFSDSKGMKDKDLPTEVSDLAAKGLSLVEPEQPPYAVYRFRIAR